MNTRHTQERDRSTAHKVVVTLGAAALIILGAAALSWAVDGGQDGGYGRSADNAGMHKGQMMGGPGMGGPRMDGKFMLRALDRHLDLTEEQHAAIERIVEDSRTAGQALRVEMHGLFEQIQASIEQDGYDEDRIRILIENQSPRMVDMMMLRVRTLAEIREQLTPAQRETAKELFESRRGRFMR